jgi:hypothetical protein
MFVYLVLDKKGSTFPRNVRNRSFSIPEDLNPLDSCLTDILELLCHYMGDTLPTLFFLLGSESLSTPLGVTSARTEDFASAPRQKWVIGAADPGTRAGKGACLNIL